MKQARLMHSIGWAVLLLLAAFDLPAVAQFIAPAPTSSPGLNISRPLTTDPAILFPMKREFVFMPGDQVQVGIFGALAFQVPTTVSMDGTITLPLAGVLSVGGLSPDEAGAVVSKRMEDLQMFHNAQVTMTILTSPGHVVTILGLDHAVVPVVSHKRLFDVLALAGGLTPSASPVVTIERPGVPDPIMVDLGNDPAHSSAANVPVFAGDTVTIGEVGSYYVIGAIKTPGVHALNGTLPTTVLQAMAISGGPVYIAKQDSTRLIRTVGSQRSVTTIPLKKIMKGQAPDPVLAADDIIFVPTSHLKEIFSLGVAVTVLGFAFSAIAILRY